MGKVGISAQRRQQQLPGEQRSNLTGRVSVNTSTARDTESDAYGILILSLVGCDITESGDNNCAFKQTPITNLLKV
jgi:hypothetical protein